MARWVGVLRGRVLACIPRRCPAGPDGRGMAHPGSQQAALSRTCRWGSGSRWPAAIASVAGDRFTGGQAAFLHRPSPLAPVTVEPPASLSFLSCGPKSREPALAKKAPCPPAALAGPAPGALPPTQTHPANSLRSQLAGFAGGPPEQALPAPHGRLPMTRGAKRPQPRDAMGCLALLAVSPPCSGSAPPWAAGAHSNRPIEL